MCVCIYTHICIYIKGPFQFLKFEFLPVCVRLSNQKALKPVVHCEFSVKFCSKLNRGSGGCFVIAHFPIVNYKASETASEWCHAYLCFSNILERAE